MTTSGLKTGWLSPNGELYECTSYDHTDAARKIVSVFGYSPVTEQNYSWSADDILMANRWVYIGISSLGVKEWRIGWKTFLTESQKIYLKPYFEDQHIPANAVAKERYKEETS